MTQTIDAADRPTAVSSMSTTKQVIAAILIGIALVIGGAGLALAFVNKSSEDSRIASLNHLVAAMRVNVNQLQGQAALMDTTQIQSQLHLINECVPEIQAQLDGMNVSSGYYSSPAGFNGDVAAYPVTLNNPTLISHDCQSFLRPSH